MRIQRLDLLRYGCFTDTHLDLPANDTDIHIIFGPNEAGKSTALSGIEDLLFGIPHNSTYNFLHDYGSMRIGAILENSGKTLEVRRRKGHKDTLLTVDEVPIAGGNNALAPFLAGADHTFFVRMFSLDHERLRTGGREILEAQDEVGQILFSAGAGLSGLRDRLVSLNEEADGLWAPRRAAHRKYYQVLERLDGAEKALHEHTVTATKWQEIKRAYDDAQEVYDTLKKHIEDISSEQRKLSRIRRVYRDIRKFTELDKEIADLGEVVQLPEDARSNLEAAEREHADAATRIDTLKEQLETERSQRDELMYDEEFLIREEDIQQFHKRRIEVQKERADLPNRYAELASAEANLRRLAEELEWKADDIEKLVKQIPSRVKAAALRTLLNSRGERMSGIASAKASIDDIEGQVADLKHELDGMGAPIDVAKLAAVLKATRESGDIASRINTAEAETREAKATIQRHFKALKPQVVEEEVLASIPVPSRDTVQNHRDAQRRNDQKMQACRERIRTVERDLTRLRKALERLAHEEDAVAPEDVAKARELRDVGWSLIRRRYIQGVNVPDSEIRAFTGTETDLTSTYEAAVAAADTLADRRFDNAQAAAQFVTISRQIAEQNELLDSFRDEERTIAEENRVLEASWQKMWDEAPFEPLDPDSMLEWLTTRNEILEAIERRAAADRHLAALRVEESEAKARILTELAVLTVYAGALDDQTLRVVIDAATAVQTQHEMNAARIRQLEEQIRKMKAEAERKRKALEVAEAAWADWQTEWVAAIENLGLTGGTQPNAANTQLDAIDQMREIAVEVNQLRHERIEKIKMDIDVFAQDVEALVAAVANDLVKVNPEDAILEVERRLDNAKRIRDLKKSKDDAISFLQKKIRESENSVRMARETIRYLQKTAGVEDIEQLKVTIQKSDKLRQLESERSRVIDALAKDGDGLSLDELKEECDAVDIDKATAREQTLEKEIKELNERLMEAAEHRTQTRNVFDTMGGDDRAAEAAAVRQAAIAEMRDVAEQYVRVRAAATLLQWVIDRYRREKQAPLLKRAGQIFATLTDGSFIDLRVEFDENDRPQLAGVRPNGELVRVGGMSTGTADQLYLVLRAASVEDYLNQATPLPFVADDLFVNFDDTRAAAGFEVLGQLARKTQVLFFTHHRHLVDIAEATLGKSVTVVSLPEPQTSAKA